MQRLPLGGGRAPRRLPSRSPGPSSRALATRTAATSPVPIWCHRCGQRFAASKAYVKHANEYCERARIWRCPESGCEETYTRAYRFCGHHREQHADCCTQSACTHAAEVVDNLPERATLGCPFCVKLYSRQRKDFLDHVIDHHRNGTATWSVDTWIQSLLQQPRVKRMWTDLCSRTFNASDPRLWPQMSWHFKDVESCISQLEDDFDGETLEALLRELLNLGAPGFELASPMGSSANATVPNSGFASAQNGASARYGQYGAHRLAPYFDRATGVPLSQPSAFDPSELPLGYHYQNVLGQAHHGILEGPEINDWTFPSGAEVPGPSMATKHDTESHLTTADSSQYSHHQYGQYLPGNCDLADADSFRQDDELAFAGHQDPALDAALLWQPDDYYLGASLAGYPTAQSVVLDEQDNADSDTDFSVWCFDNQYRET